MSMEVFFRWWKQIQTKLQPAKGRSPFRYTGSIRPGTLSPRRAVPLRRGIAFPSYAYCGYPMEHRPNERWVIQPKTEEEIIRMRAAGRLAREVLDLAGRAVEPGITTDEIDGIVHEAIVQAGAYPSPLNYHRYPKSLCTSRNEVICHGVPDDSELIEGDIINLDVSVFLDGFHGDCSEMFVVGKEMESTSKQLLQATYDCWITACKIVQPGRSYQDIGSTIEDYISQCGFRSFPMGFGHGIGQILHDNPDVHNVRNFQHNGIMEVGHTFTIEPAICEGTNRSVEWPDGWTIATADGKRSAQFEHTLLVTPDGVEALTGKTEDSMLQFWEKESSVHKGFWLGTSKQAVHKANNINSKLGI